MIFAIAAGVGVVILALIGPLDSNGDGSVDGSELKNRIGFGGTSEVKTAPVQAPISRGKPPSAPVNRTVEAVPSTAIKPASPLTRVGTSDALVARAALNIRR